MKQIVFYALASALVLGAGCSRENNDGTTETTMPEERAEDVQETPIVAAEKTKEVTGEVAEKTKEAVAAVTVKAEDVMDDLNQSIAAVKEKAAAFDKDQLMAYTATYKDVILEKKEQVAALTAKVKGLSAMELIGDKGKALKAELTKCTEQLGGLKDRYNVYLEQLGAFGVDLSAYTL